MVYQHFIVSIDYTKLKYIFQEKVRCFCYLIALILSFHRVSNAKSTDTITYLPEAMDDKGPT